MERVSVRCWYCYNPVCELFEIVRSAGRIISYFVDLQRLRRVFVHQDSVRCLYCRRRIGDSSDSSSLIRLHAVGILINYTGNIGDGNDNFVF